MDVTKLSKAEYEAWVLTNVLRLDPQFYQKNFGSIHQNCNIRKCGPVGISDGLYAAAVSHSKDMAANGCFSHETCGCRGGGCMFTDRFSKFGVSKGGRGSSAENIYEGSPDAYSVIDGWATSQGHCNNIMDPNIGSIAVGIVGSFATQTLAGPFPQGGFIQGAYLKGIFVAVFNGAASVKLVIDSREPVIMSGDNGLYVFKLNVPQCTKYRFEVGNSVFPQAGYLSADCSTIFQNSHIFISNSGSGVSGQPSAPPVNQEQIGSARITPPSNQILQPNMPANIPEGDFVMTPKAGTKSNTNSTAIALGCAAGASVLFGAMFVYRARTSKTASSPPQARRTNSRRPYDGGRSFSNGGLAAAPYSTRDRPYRTERHADVTKKFKGRRAPRENYLPSATLDKSRRKLRRDKKPAALKSVSRANSDDALLPQLQQTLSFPEDQDVTQYVSSPQASFPRTPSRMVLKSPLNPHFQQERDVGVALSRRPSASSTSSDIVPTGMSSPKLDTATILASIKLSPIREEGTVHIKQHRGHAREEKRLVHMVFGNSEL